jgi:hypothetical protein
MPFALTNNPSQSEVSEAINYLLANFGSNLVADPSNGQITGPSGVVIAYLYRYIAVKYADSFDGSVNFGDSPTNKAYYGLRNSDDPVESTNFADYIWLKVAGGGFGTTKFLFYQTSGGRQIDFVVSTSIPSTGYAPVPTNSIDLDNITTATPGADVFAAFFQPTSLQVPRNGNPLVASFAGINPSLYGIYGTIPVDFVTSQTDSDAAFVNNTWRIGGSSTTGNADIVYTNITIGSPTDAGNYAYWPNPTAMSSSPATIYVPVRYKNSLGIINQVSPAQIQLIFVDQGTDGAQNAEANLYQWSISTPGNPSGTSTYTWATGANSGYTGGNGWSTSIPANPGTPLLVLWVASKKVTAASGATTSSVSWTTGFSVAGASQNGATGPSGFQNARPVVYQWAVTIPSGPVGTSTFTWATSTFTPIPSGWSLSISAAPSVGYTLWAATVNLSDTATATTSTINWSTASITAAGYAGTDGTNGASARICYSKTTLTSLASTPTTITTSGPSSFPPNDSWGSGTVWQATPPAITAGESVYQSDGIYSYATNNTVWNVPYISALKVGSLSAITTNTGNLTVTGTIQSNTAAISGTTMTGSGAVLYSSGLFALGNSSTNITFNGSSLNLNGPVVTASNLNVANLAAVSSNTGNLNITGTLQSGSAAISGTSMTGAGGVLYSGGNFAFGNSSTNISFNGSTMTLNGAIVGTGNIQANSLVNIASSFSTSTVSVTGTSVYTVVQQVNVTLSSAATVVINASTYMANANTPPVFVRLYRDSTIIWDSGTLGMVLCDTYGFYNNSPATFMLSEYLSSGSYTFYLKFRPGNTNTLNLYNRFISVQASYV